MIRYESILPSFLQLSHKYHLTIQQIKLGNENQDEDEKNEIIIKEKEEREEEYEMIGEVRENWINSFSTMSILILKINKQTIQQIIIQDEEDHQEMTTDHTQIDEWIHSTIFQSTKNKNKILDTPC